MVNEFQTFAQVIDYAIDREIRSLLFYRAWARRVTDTELQGIFRQFADQELKHQKKLAKVKQGQCKYLKGDMPTLGLGIAEAVEETVPYPEMLIEEAMALAMTKEKQAYHLYLQLASNAETEDLADLFLNLANEEANHKVRLEIEYDERFSHVQ